MEACLYVRPGDRTTLERLVADGNSPQKLAARARIVLLSGSGLGTSAIQRKAQVSKPTVWRWQAAYMEGGIERLLKEIERGTLTSEEMVTAKSCCVTPSRMAPITGPAQCEVPPIRDIASTETE